MLWQVLNYLFPQLCGGCGQLRDLQLLCSSCRAVIQPVLSVDLRVAAQQKIPVMAVGAYTGPLVRLVLGKARGDRIAARELGMLMAERLGPIAHEIDYIVPVPIHWSRLLWRGYDHVWESGMVLSRATGIPMISGIKKIRRTPFQSTLSAVLRAENCRNSCALTSSAALLKDKRVLVIDDVMTTGSTLLEVARILTRANPASIIALVGARAV